MAVNFWSIWRQFAYPTFITDRVIAREVMQSPPTVCPSVCPFPLYLSNRLTFDLDLLHVCGSLPWLAGD